MADRKERMAGRSVMAIEHPLTPATFAVQFQGSWRLLWCIAAAVVGDRALADDVLQEAAMVALGKLTQFDPASNFVAWMGQIVRFVALNHSRKRIRSAHSAGNSVDPHTLEVTSVDNRLAHGEVPRSDFATVNGRGELGEAQEDFDDRLLQALRSLDDTARACLLLRTLMDMPYRDISLALDIPEGTAMSHVHRARISLREKLADTSLAPAYAHASSRLFRSGSFGDSDAERNGHVHG